MSWVAVPNLIEGRDQLNTRFPNRDKSSEGMLGDKPHQLEISSHNPDDESGVKAEFNDHDGKEEVRAWDADKDLRDPAGIQAEQMVQQTIAKARSGEMWWLRYIIYNRRIWHKRDGFVTHAYTGSNPHTDHVHFNSDFTQQADEVTGTNWHFGELGGATPVANPTPSSGSVVKRGSTDTTTVKHIQTFFHDVFPSYRNSVRVKRGQNITVDGNFGDQTEAWVVEFQRRVNIHQDGAVGPVTKGKMKQYGYKY